MESNKEGKEALTARQILDKHYSLEGLKAVEKHNLVLAMEEFASLKVAEAINKPEILDFIEGVKIEAEHQTQRWGIEKEEIEPPHHYILVTNKLLGKMSVDIWDKNKDKFKHHIIALAAEMFNLHRQIEKEGTEINRYFNE